MRRRHSAWPVWGGVLVVVVGLAGCADVLLTLEPLLVQADMQRASTRAQAQCAWLLVTTHWPGWRTRPRVSGNCSGEVTQPPRPVGE